MWSPRQKRYQLWLSLPQKLRKPKTETLLAQELGVKMSTLAEWRFLPGFWQEVNQSSVQVLWNALPEIYEKIAAQALLGKGVQQKLVLEILGLGHNAIEIKHSGKIEHDQLVIVLTGEEAARAHGARTLPKVDDDSLALPAPSPEDFIEGVVNEEYEELIIMEDAQDAAEEADD